MSFESMIIKSLSWEQDQSDPWTNHSDWFYEPYQIIFSDPLL